LRLQGFDVLLPNPNVKTFFLQPTQILVPNQLVVGDFAFTDVHCSFFNLLSSR
jgi:hypothetical protein